MTTGDESEEGQGRRVLILGASGVIGRAALAHFAGHPAFAATGVSRRSPGLRGANHIPLDLLDREQVLATLGDLQNLQGVTHVVDCTSQAAPAPASESLDPAAAQTHHAMLKNVLEAIAPARSLQHLSLLGGAKTRPPEAEFLQEQASREGFAFTIWQTPVIFGHAVGAPMNWLAAIGAFAGLRKAAGEPLVWPAGRAAPAEGLDARLLARAFEWATDAKAAQNQVFDITNGDVFVWEDLWSAAAEVFEMELADPEPIRLQEYFSDKAELWERLRTEHALCAPPLLDWLGDSPANADRLWGTEGNTPPASSPLSTIKLREAGFGACIDSQEMLVQWLRWLIEERWLPR